MVPYKSKSGKTSGVVAYEIGADWIDVLFSNYHKYKYTYGSAGKQKIEKMKLHALAGEGLSTYIAQHNPRFEKILS